MAQDLDDVHHDDAAGLLHESSDEHSDGDLSGASSRRSSNKSSLSSEMSLEANIGTFLKANTETRHDKRRRVSIEERRLALEETREERRAALEETRLENERLDRIAQRQYQATQTALMMQMMQQLTGQQRQT